MELHVIGQEIIELPERRVYVSPSDIETGLAQGTPEHDSLLRPPTDEDLPLYRGLRTTPADPDVRRAMGEVETIYRQKRLGRDVVVGFLPDRSAPTIERAIAIPVMRLHCPKHAGCKASETYAVADTGKVEIKVTLFGVNAAAAVEATLAVENHWETADGECLQIVLQSTLRLEAGQTLIDGTPISFGLRATVTAVEGGTRRQELIPAGQDHCRVGTSSVDDDLRLTPPFEVMAGTNRLTLKTGTKVSGALGVGLKLFDENLEVGLGYSRELSVEGTRTFELAAPGRYVAFAPSAGQRDQTTMDVLWATDEVPLA